MFSIIASGLAHLTATDTVFFLNLFLKKAMARGEIFPVRINITARSEGGMHRRCRRFKRRMKRLRGWGKQEQGPAVF